jgi:hypothetical protein
MRSHQTQVRPGTCSLTDDSDISFLGGTSCRGRAVNSEPATDVNAAQAMTRTLLTKERLCQHIESRKGSATSSAQETMAYRYEKDGRDRPRLALHVVASSNARHLPHDAHPNKAKLAPPASVALPTRVWGASTRTSSWNVSTAVRHASVSTACRRGEFETAAAYRTPRVTVPGRRLKGATRTLAASVVRTVTEGARTAEVTRLHCEDPEANVGDLLWHALFVVDRTRRREHRSENSGATGVGSSVRTGGARVRSYAGKTTTTYDLHTQV